MGKPFIGILGNLLMTEGGKYSGVERAYVNNDYIKAVEMAGGVPFIMPVTDDAEVIENQIRKVDGVVLPGGYDVNPQYYGEEPQPNLGFIYPEVDKCQLKAIEYCAKYNKPLLGICRGMQLLNIAYGGTLYQDISYIDRNCILKHVQNAKRNAPLHTVEIVEDSYLYKIFGNKVCTNSFHHQCIKNVAEGFKVAAVAKDGVIEAIESEKDGFSIGVQWHPEAMIYDSISMLDIFKKLIQKSNNL